MFFTKIKIEKSDFTIQHQNKIITIGSCFSDNMGQKLKQSYFDVSTNPFGVLYNPISVKNGIELLLDNKSFGEKDLFFYNHKWHSFSHSSHFSYENKKECLENINSKLKVGQEHFQNSDFLFITFGTAWVFEEKKSERIVANCHKLPSDNFRRYRLKVEDIVVSYKDLIERILIKNPNLKIIFTVSPIRHWKDGANENTLSKSTLHLAINELLTIFSSVSYFPAYEIVMDELRDYRFYSSDMIHPNEVAVDYLWERFSEVYFTKKTDEVKKELEKFCKITQHKISNCKTKENIEFLKNREKRREILLLKYPFLAGRI